jgi:hypothetical protein
LRRGQVSSPLLERDSHTRRKQCPTKKTDA